MHIYFMTHMPTSQHKHPRLRSLNLQFGRKFSSSVLYTKLIWNIRPSKEECCLKKYINFTHFSPKLLPFGVGVDHKNFHYVGVLTLQMLRSRFCKDWLNSSWKENVNRRRTTDDSRLRTPILSNRSPEHCHRSKIAEKINST